MGWQFTVTVPSWTQTELQNGDLVVFYRVEVRIQQSASHQPPVIKTRSVLRRFTHFTKLGERLQEELGPSALAGKPPPARHTLLAVNKRPDLIEARRRELEQWLWKLVSDPAVARSRTLNKFLELSVAAKLVERASAAAAATIAEEGPAAPLVRPPTPDDAAAPFPEPAPSGIPPATYSEDDGTLSQWNDAASGVTDSVDIHRPRSHLITAQRDPGHALATAPSSAAGLSTNGTTMRLGLRVEERSSVKRQVQLLKDRMDAASDDLTAAVHALRLEQARAGELATRVQELEARLAAGVTERETELEVLLAAEREQSATLAHQLEEQGLAMDLLRQQALTADQAQGDREAVLAARVAELEAVQGVCVWEAERAALVSRVAQLEGDVADRESKACAAESRFRDDLKVLAREVKSLRRQLAAVGQQRDESTLPPE